MNAFLNHYFLRSFQNNNQVLRKLTPFFIVSLGFLIRLHFAYHLDFWFDEGFRWHVSNQPLNKLLLLSAGDNHPPLFNLILKFGILINQSHLWLRFITVMTGSIYLVILYKFITKVSSIKIATLTTLLASFSPLLVYFSAVVMSYQLLALIALLFIFSFICFKEKQTKTKGVILFVSALVGVYTHYLFIIYVLIIVLYDLLVSNNSKNLNFWTIFGLGLVFLYFPWVWLFFRYTHSACWCFNAHWGIPLAIGSLFVNGVGETTNRDLLNHTTSFLITSITSAAVGFFLLIYGIKKDLYRNKIMIFIICFLLIILGLFSITERSFSPRVSLLFAPFAYYYVAIGTYSIFRRNYLYSFLFASFLFGSLLLTIGYSNLDSPKFTNSSKFLLPRIKSSEIVLHLSPYTYYSYLYYLYKTSAQFVVTQNEDFNQPSPIIQTIPISENALFTNSLWVVYIPKWTEPELVSKIISKYNAANYKKTVYIFFDLELWYMSK